MDVANRRGPFERLREMRKLYDEADWHLRHHDYQYYRTQLYTEGDRSGRLLAWLFHDEQQHTPIGAIRLADGTMVSSQAAINDAFRIITQRYIKCNRHRIANCWSYS
ncbi:hypothetical protein NDU88_000647 [Pleurodeles waltl]|uniref:Uncharacterized protein n=1 Tax=Pleurodeles waltl TaxID=8319 RepID=A0AAV7MSG0_PLEWA|nr:hypothetical protein NDU88_000647 [Pleurodeles waltl]